MPMSDSEILTRAREAAIATKQPGGPGYQRAARAGLRDKTPRVRGAKRALADLCKYVGGFQPYNGQTSQRGTAPTSSTSRTRPTTSAINAAAETLAASHGRVRNAAERLALIKDAIRKGIELGE